MDEQNNYTIELEDVFNAYFDCRHNKRNTSNAINFEINYEDNVIDLWREINEGTYEIGKSIAFIVKYPVYREVFAADFRDRVIHHLVINKLLPYFEEEFISSSYSCRKDKGVLYGVKEVSSFIEECSNNYTEDCYVLKMDIQSFFMSINKELLSDMIIKFIDNKYPDNKDKELIKKLCRQIILHRPETNCKRKSPISDWDSLPKHKSLFNVGGDKGLPIGNLTSQIFANYYMNPFDHYVKDTLGFKYYGRYVDDFIIISKDKKKLLEAIPLMKSFMQDNLKLTIHPKKIYIQHCTKGVKFIGGLIKPFRKYISNRTKGRFYYKLTLFNRKPITLHQIEKLVCTVNSYIGFMIHYKSYNVRKDILINSGLLDKWLPYIIIDDNLTKININKEAIKSLQ